MKQRMDNLDMFHIRSVAGERRAMPGTMSICIVHGLSRKPCRAEPKTDKRNGGIVAYLQARLPWCVCVTKIVA